MNAVLDRVEYCRSGIINQSISQSFNFRLMADETSVIQVDKTVCEIYKHMTIIYANLNSKLINYLV